MERGKIIFIQQKRGKRLIAAIGRGNISNRGIACVLAGEIKGCGGVIACLGMDKNAVGGFFVDVYISKSELFRENSL